MNQCVTYIVYKTEDFMVSFKIEMQFACNYKNIHEISLSLRENLAVKIRWQIFISDI